MGGTHEAWGLRMGALRLAAGVWGSEICERKWGFLGGEVASPALLRLRVNISATSDPHWGADEEWLGHMVLSWWCWGMGQHFREVGTTGLGPSEWDSGR